MKPSKVNKNIKTGIRFQADDNKGDRGWIHYVGPVHTSKKKNYIYVGVEWDSENRGKHDGETDGTRYFRCKPGHGSFIHPKRVKLGRDLMSALKSKYTDDDPDATQDMYLVAESSNQYRGQFKVPITFVGQDKIYEQINDISQLQHAGLDECFVSSSKPESIADQLPELRVLNLEGNLLTKWSDVARFCSQLTLWDLTLSANYLIQPIVDNDDISSNNGGDDSNDGNDDMKGKETKGMLLEMNSPVHVREFKSSFLELRVLYMNNVPNAWDSVYTLASNGCLPMLEQLHLANNNISSVPQTADEIAKAFPTLKVLNLSSNKFSDWAEIMSFSLLPSLLKLHLNNNLVTSLDFKMGLLDKYLHETKDDKNDNDENEGDEKKQEPTVSETSSSSSSSSTNPLPDPYPFGSIVHLALNGNKLEDFDRTCRELGQFPNLFTLRLQETPLTKEAGSALNLRYLLICRVPKLMSLNLSQVRVRERDDAEKFYLKWCIHCYHDLLEKDKENSAQKAGTSGDNTDSNANANSSQVDVVNTGNVAPIGELFPRWTELIKMHGAPREYKEWVAANLAGKDVQLDDALENSGHKLKKRLIPFQLVSEVKAKGKIPKPKNKKLAPSTTIGNLKTLVNRVFRLRKAVHDLHLVFQEENLDGTFGDEIIMDDTLKPLSHYGAEMAGRITIKMAP